MSLALPAGLSRRSAVLLALWTALLLVAPLLVDAYLLSVLTLVLWLAYTGQAWNVMMGFAGQLSLGYTLYVGLAAYASAVIASSRPSGSSACSRRRSSHDGTSATKPAAPTVAMPKLRG